MNDELKGKSGKVKVMYVRSDDESETRGHNPRTGKGGGRNTPRQEGGRRGSRDDKSAGRDRKRETSPWRTVSRAPGDEANDTPDHGGISGKSYIDPEILRRQRAEETRVYGENACQSLFRNRPESIVRAWFIQSVTPRFKEALRWMAANRKAYHVVDDAELAKASGTERHGGVCFLIKKRNGMAVEQWIDNAPADDCVLALEDIGNPHNVGAMLRTCAHFGAKGVLVPDAAVLESGAAVRTAEGGAEHVQAITGASFAAALDQFREAGYTVVSTVTGAGLPLFKTQLPQKMVLVPGFEREEQESDALNHSDMLVSVNGTGDVDGLNVSVATGVVLAEWWRQHKA